MAQKFYIVVRDQPQMFASKRHKKLLDAVHEAERLTSKEGDKFFICESFAVSEPPKKLPVKWHKCDE